MFPTINYEKLLSILTEEEKQIVQYVFLAKSGQLRKSKVKFNPPVRTEQTEALFADSAYPYVKNVRRYPTNEDDVKAKANYVWRIICFCCVNKYPHNCLPVGADFVFVGTVEEERKTKVQLDALIDKILAFIPKEQWYSASRWARALGILPC